jgi:predicted hydrocarbon binding protein
MVDDFKSLRDGILRAVLGQSSNSTEDESREDSSTADARRALLAALFARAGKGKDEVVQIVAREIGLAIAALLKEPLSKIADNQKLQISFELVPKESSPKNPDAAKKKHRKKHFKRKSKTP